DGAGLDSNYMINGGLEYTEGANQETFLVVQIETPEAIMNVDEIAAVEGVDCLFLGTGDLSLRINKLNSKFDLEESIKKVVEAAQKHGKVWCRPVSGEEDILTILKQNSLFIPYGGDFMMLMNGLKQHSAELDSCIKKQF
ncbi:MAG: aldolase/citrate lyase family protein, partial [SAR324 cluster bacterium]|nr:aldolase/citrate lyase family protein [SAR324 cluster bacterium]